MLKYVTLVCSFAVLAMGCGSGKDVADPNAPVVARAGKDMLDVDNYKSIFVGTGNAKDSTENAKKTIDSWATEALFYQEALEKLDKEELQVEKEVEAYRRELVNHIYSTRIIEANLDTVITPEEIEAYYNSHSDNFILKENIVKVNYIKVPVRAQGLEKIKRLLLMGSMADQSQLKALCAQNAENYFLNDSTWLYVEEIKKEIPGLREEPDFNLVTGRVMQFSDDLYYYYLKIKDVKVKNGLSPLNFERQNIKKFILNNRKAQLILQYKQLLLEKAKSNKAFETFTPALQK